MDRETLRLLADEVFEVARWYGVTKHYQSEMFGLGRVSELHALTREETHELLREVNRRIAKRQRDEYAEELIQSAIRNVN